MKNFTKIQIIMLFFLSFSLFTTCSKDEDPLTEPDDEEETGENQEVTPEFAGFDFELSENTYWEYYWSYDYNSVVQGEGGTHVKLSGNFRITLGPQTRIENTDAYQLLTTGDYQDPNFDYTPRWQYMAIKEHQILGSSDGTTLEVIFDAVTGEWQGGGFFMEISPDIQSYAETGSIDNEFLQTPSIRIGRSANQDFCESIAGEVICSNDDAYTIHEYEYYKEGIGIIGYYSYAGYQYSGGGFYTAHSYERHLGLVASSLAADNDFIPREPPWTKKADMPTPRHGHTSVVVNGDIYVLGGYDENSALDRVDIYNPQTDTWTSGSPMPEALLHHSSTVAGYKIYVLGGRTESPYGPVQRKVWAYDTKRGVWTAKKEMPAAAWGHTSLALGGYIWVFPGNTTDVYAYELDTDTWFAGTSSTYLRLWEHAACNIGTSIYITGGKMKDWGKWKYTNSCSLFDLTESYGSENAWRSIAPLDGDRAEHSAVVYNDQIFVVGGRNSGEVLRTIERYDPVADSWDTKFPMPLPRTEHTSAVVNGKIYVMGGRSDSYDPVATVYEYNPDNDR